jgi:peptide/nickel transport system permease protein
MARGIKAIKSGLFLIVAAVVICGDAVAPYAYERQVRDEPNAPASTLRFRDLEGNFHFRPFVYKRQLVDRLNYDYVDSGQAIFPITFLTRGDAYKLLGFFSGDIHLFGTTDANARVSLLGTDALGRDRFSRLVIAIRFSLIVCIAGTLLSSLIGIGYGMLSGYSRRSVDSIMMGVADSVLALPTLIIILAARAAFPLELPPTRAAFILIVIFALTGWAEMARLARGLVRTAKDQDYVAAAKASGASATSILFRHIFPNISPSLVTQASITVPYFLLSEVALSYLGVGLQEPVPSLGNMLASAGDLGQLQRHPILLLSPAIVIFIFVLVIRLYTSGQKRKLGVS